MSSLQILKFTAVTRTCFTVCRSPRDKEAEMSAEKVTALGRQGPWGDSIRWNKACASCHSPCVFGSGKRMNEITRYARL